MIGVKTFCKCNNASNEEPNDNEIKLGSISGHVTENNILLDISYDLIGAKVTLYQSGKERASTTTFTGGLYALDAIAIGEGYQLVIEKDSTFESEVFSIASGEKKIINAALTTNKLPF